MPHFVALDPGVRAARAVLEVHVWRARRPSAPSPGPGRSLVFILQHLGRAWVLRTVSTGCSRSRQACAPRLAAPPSRQGPPTHTGMRCVGTRRAKLPAPARRGAGAPSLSIRTELQCQAGPRHLQPVAACSPARGGDRGIESAARVAVALGGRHPSHPGKFRGSVTRTEWLARGRRQGIPPPAKL